MLILSTSLLFIALLVCSAILLIQSHYYLENLERLKLNLPKHEKKIKRLSNTVETIRIYLPIKTDRENYPTAKLTAGGR